jgi:hypothetical protein
MLDHKPTSTNWASSASVLDRVANFSKFAPNIGGGLKSAQFGL